MGSDTEYPLHKADIVKSASQLYNLSPDKLAFINSFIIRFGCSYCPTFISKARTIFFNPSKIIGSFFLAESQAAN
jgi:hypothetical protein